MDEMLVWPVAALSLGCVVIACSLLGFFGWIRGLTLARKLNALEQRLRTLELGQSATGTPR
jgi:hypothetical protein